MRLKNGVYVKKLHSFEEKCDISVKKVKKYLQIREMCVIIR